MSKSPLLCALILPVLIFAQDAEDNSGDTSSRRLRKLEKQHRRLEKRVDELSASARGCPTDNGFFGSASFVYWRASNHGYVYAYNMQTTALSAGPLNQQFRGDWKRIDYSYDPGFKVGLGWNTPRDSWDVFLQWTSYFNHSSQTTTVDATAGEFAAGIGLVNFEYFFPFGESMNRLPEVQASYKLNYNTFDLEFGISLFLRKTFSIRPEVGIRSAWIHQKFRYKDLGPASNSGIQTLAVPPAFLKNKTTWWGLGPRAGIRSDWHLPFGFSFYADTSLSLLYGTRLSWTALSAFFFNEGIFRELESNGDKYSDLFPTIQLIGGLKWSRCVYRDKVFFSMNTAWETNYWWDQFDLTRFTTEYNFLNFPLTLAGLTASFQLDY